MTEKSAAQKLLLKPDQRAFAVNAPRGLAALLGALPAGAKLVKSPSSPLDLVLLFTRDRKELAEHLPAALAAVGESTLFWIAYPKKTSAIATDLSRDEGWQPVYAAGYEGVSLVAVDETWSAMRYKSTDGGPARPREHTKKGAIVVPADLEAALAQSPPARERFHALAPSHRREHVEAVEQAKKPETRAKRIAKAVEMILALPAKKK